MTIPEPSEISSLDEAQTGGSVEASQPLIVVFPRGQLHADDKARMTLHGILCVEADSPKDVCQLQLTTPLYTSVLSGDAILRAALNALAKGVDADDYNKISGVARARSEFVRLLASSVKEHP